MTKKTRRKIDAALKAKIALGASHRGSMPFALARCSLVACHLLNPPAAGAAARVVVYLWWVASPPDRKSVV